MTKFSLWDRTDALWEAGDPTNVRFLVRGKLIYDPRLDSTQVIDDTTSPPTTGSGSHRADDPSTWAFSDNPALCWADFLRDEKFSPLSGGVSSTRIDWPSVAAAADDCETLVPIPTASTQERFTCNGVLWGSDTPEENVSRILSSMNGEQVYSLGKYYVYAGVYAAPEDTLDESDIIGPIQVKSALVSDRRINTLKAVYVDPDKEWKETETAAITFAAFKDVRDGGEELIDTLELHMTNNWFMAQRICQLTLQQANEELVLSIPCNLRAAALVPGQRINLNIAERGWNPKIFKVLNWEFFDQGGDQIGVNLEVIEDDAGAYADPAEGEYNTTNAAGVLTVADPVPIPGIDTIPEVGAGNYGEGAWNIEITENQNDLGGVNDGEIRFQAGIYRLPDGTIREIDQNTEMNTPYEGDITPPDGTFYIVWGDENPDTRFADTLWGEETTEAAGIFAAVYDRTRGQWYAVDNGGGEYAFTMLDTDYVVARGIKTSASGGIDSLTSLISFVNDPRATDGAQAGDNLLDEAGAVLSDIDLRNDEIVQAQLGAINFNASMSFPARWPTGNIGPSGYILNSTIAYPGYVDDDVRDELLVSGQTNDTLNMEAIRANPDTTYEIVALVRGDSVAVTLDMRAEELDVDLLPAGKRFIGSNSVNPLMETRTRVITLVSNQAVGTTYELISATYTPTESCRWFSPSIFDNANNNAFRVEWWAVRTRSAQPGDQFEYGGLLRNGGMSIQNYDSPVRRPAGYWLGATTDNSLMSYQDAERSIMQLGADGDTDGVAMMTSAFQVNPNNRYRITVRLRGRISGTAGLYLRLIERDTDLPEGARFLRSTADATCPSYDDDYAATRDRSVTTVSSGERWVRISGGVDFENDPVPTTYTEYIGDYRPTATALWASFEILNFTDYDDSIWIDRITIEPNPGTLSPEDSVDVGQFTGEYTATAASTANIIATDTAEQSTGATSWTTLRTINVGGTGTLRVEFDARSAADPLEPTEAASEFRFRQGGVTLTTSPATMSIKSNGNWTTDAIDVLVTLGADPTEPIELQAQNTDGFNTRIRNIDVFADSILGESFS